MIIERLKGGLGNRLFIYVAARGIASKHNIPPRRLHGVGNLANPLHTFRANKIVKIINNLFLDFY